jgi:cytoskeleton protein RodZ
MNAENETQTVGELPATATEASPGAMIRQGRERMNLSLDELAGVTKLSYNTIEALERDDFNALLEAVYVRGYYRKCAKVLDIPEKALLDAYQARVAPKQPLPPAKLRLASGADLGSASRLPVTLAIAGALVAVLVCAVVWVARGTGGQPAQQTVGTPAAVESQPTVVPSAEIAVPPATPAEVPATAAPDATLATPSAAPATDASAPTAAAPAATVPATATAPAAAPAAPAASAGSAVLSFSATSWVRVDDASGKTLFNGLAQPGESQVLNGALPLNVFLGNAPAVKVEFGGKPFDTQAFQRDNKTARFTLPAR